MCLPFRPLTKARNGDNKVTFPKLLICSHSMHSKEKLIEKYPNITSKQVKELYGQGTGLLNEFI